MACLTMDVLDGISQSISNAPPSHYMVKVQLFSLLAKNSIERYESREFDVEGSKWKLVLYPSGNKSKNVKEHISLYLALDKASLVHPGWKIYVNFRLFLLDQKNNNYLVLQGKGRRYHKMKLEWGFDQFIPLKDFNNESKGYLVDDICVFGAEVFVCGERSTSRGESLVMMKDAITCKHVWEIDNYSKLEAECHSSKPFIAGNYKWNIKLYPNGKGDGLDNYISLYLALADPATLPPNSKIYAKIVLRILNQKYSYCHQALKEIVLRILDQKYSHHHQALKGSYWFSASSSEKGASRFILTRDFTSQYIDIVKDRCLVEAKITILGVVDALS